MWKEFQGPRGLEKKSCHPQKWPPFIELVCTGGALRHILCTRFIEPPKNLVVMEVVLTSGG